MAQYCWDGDEGMVSGLSARDGIGGFVCCSTGVAYRHVRNGRQNQYRHWSESLTKKKKPDTFPWQVFWLGNSLVESILWL
jgi:hypothetical protein